MSTNNFHKLIDEELRAAPPLPPHIKTNVNGNMGVYQFIAKTIELYIPRAIDTIMVAMSPDLHEPIPPAKSQNPENRELEG